MMWRAGAVFACAVLFLIPLVLVVRQWEVLARHRINVEPAERRSVLETSGWLWIALKRSNFSTAGMKARRDFLWRVAALQLSLLVDVVILVVAFG